MLMDNSLCRELSAWAPLEGRRGGVCPETHPGPWLSPCDAPPSTPVLHPGAKREDENLL